MKQEILNRLQALGGDISKVKGNSLQEDLLAITFNTVLYEKPQDTPWAKADEKEPIYGLGEWVDANFKLYQTDKKAFYEQMIAEFYQLTEKPYGQHFASLPPSKKVLRIMKSGMMISLMMNLQTLQKLLKLQVMKLQILYNCFIPLAILIIYT